MDYSSIMKDDADFVVGNKKEGKKKKIKEKESNEQILERLKSTFQEDEDDYVE